MISAEPGRTDKNCFRIGIKLRYDGLVANIPIQEIMNGIGLFSEKSIKKCMHEMLRTFRVSVNLTVPAPKNTDTSNHSVLTTTALQA